LIVLKKKNSKVLDSLRNASANFASNCSLKNIWEWNVSGLVYMGDEPPKDFSELRTSELIKIAVYAFISLFGVVGNALVIFLVVKHRGLRTTINYYLINLAVADIIISMFCIWIHLIDSVSGAPWVLGPFICKISGFLQSEYHHRFHTLLSDLCSSSVQWTV
jgi:hypothetical protein